MELILYAKPGCHLCEGLEEKLRAIDQLEITLEVRDILTQPRWFEQYQYEIPVLFWRIDGQEQPIPRPSPRLSVEKLTQLLQQQRESPSK
ncbi:glutaredoxin family protein [filamentous cyanobacterium LEGE 11480]|uniref:Glutaredoxin family protein n=2 Tax=Romeriopsis TaxID=2992131 RepID=A0A928VW13_9CYAN|nr:glutaredoxin family protein [Romeriopsis navalis LEGE 11480]